MSLYYLCVCFKSLLHHDGLPHLRKSRRFDARVHTCSHVPSCCQPSAPCPVTYMETFSKMPTVRAVLVNAAEQGKSAYLNCLYSLSFLSCNTAGHVGISKIEIFCSIDALPVGSCFDWFKPGGAGKVEKVSNSAWGTRNLVFQMWKKGLVY